MTRLETFQSLMRQRGLDAVVLRLPENVVMFSHYWPRNGLSFLAIPVEGEARLLVPGPDEAAARDGMVADVVTFGWARLADGSPWPHIVNLLGQFAQDRGIAPQALIGVERGFEIASPALCAGEMLLPGEDTWRAVSDAFQAVELVSIVPELDIVRNIKTDGEIRRLDLVNKISKQALQSLSERLVPGVTEIELAAQLEADVAVLTARNGQGSGRAWSQVMSGKRTALGYFPGNVSENRRIEEGDFVMVELAVVMDGFWADLTRTYVCGEPSDQQRTMLDIVSQAQSAAIQAVRAGVVFSVVDRCAREVIERAGLGASFVHHTGHGVGFRYHEPTLFVAPDSNNVLETGMVLTIEPGIYIEGLGGIRIEDNLVVTGSGCRILGQQ